MCQQVCYHHLLLSPAASGEHSANSCLAGSGEGFKVILQLGNTITLAIINKIFAKGRKLEIFHQENCVCPVAKNQAGSLESS